VIGMRAGRYAFYAGSQFANEIASVEIPALAPILEGARRSMPAKHFANALKGQLKEFPYRTADFGKELAALGLNTKDLKVAMQLNGRLPLGDLLAHGRGDLLQSYSLMWFLSLTGTVAFSKQPVGGTAGDAAVYRAQDQIAPRRKKPLPEKIASELREQAVKIITSSYFRVLGLEITANTEDVERAYHQVAAKFHPDSYPEFDTSEIQDLLDSVQEKLGASYRVLSVEERRKAYLQYLLSRLDVRRGTSVNADAEIAVKRGEAALKRKDWRSAIGSFEEAVSLHPREPEYYCFLAWATYQGAGGDSKQRATAAQKLLKKALGFNPYLERAQVIGAIIDNESGDPSSARKRLHKVLEMNPNSALARAALRKIGR
jgi:tetratricopeptide (TPR) repeat protein